VIGKLSGIAKLPLVPEIVTLEFPMNVDVLYAEVSVSVALPDVLMEAGEKLAVTPAGNQLAESATGPVNPFTGDTLMV
jgi:hypothetical protein